MLKFTILFITCLATGSLANVAPFITPCAVTDNACILESSKKVLTHIAPGVPELNMTPLDPLIVDSVVTNSGTLKLSFKDVIVTGLSKCKIIKMDRDPVKSTVDFMVECPVKLVGEYTASGKILFVDIEGNGPFEISGDNLQVNGTLTLKEHTKEDKKYYRIAGVSYKYTPVSVFKFKLENLYGGDVAKAEPVNKILEESWRELITDNNIGKPVVDQMISKIVPNINQLFTEVPISELQLP